MPLAGLVREGGPRGPGDGVPLRSCVGPEVEETIELGRERELERQHDIIHPDMRIEI